MLKELGCFPDDRTFSLEETSFAEAFPGPESFGRRDADVALVAGRFKANIESLLQLYPEILAKHPELFDGSDIDLKSFALLGPDSKQGNGNLTVPTAAAGTLALSSARIPKLSSRTLRRQAQTQTVKMKSSRGSFTQRRVRARRSAGSPRTLTRPQAGPRR